MSARKIIARSLPRVPEACKQAGWRRRGRPQVLGGMALALLLAGCQTPEAPRHQAAFARDGGDTGKAARHVIVMINDGAGWGTWDAAAYWQYGSRAGTPYAGFPVRYAMTTYPLNNEDEPTGDDESQVNYDEKKAWRTEPDEDPQFAFKAYEYLDDDAADSAAAGTSLASGIKTYNNGINMDNRGRPVPFVTQVARAAGKATGVVTTVPFSHATPATFGAHALSRKHYHRIADQMLRSGDLGLIMGMGAPGFNVNGTACGQLRADESRKGCDDAHEYLSAASWRALQAGEIVPQGHERPWTVIRDKAEFEAMAEGRLSHRGPLIGLPKVAGNGTLQQGREGRITGRDVGKPSGEAFVRTVPSLATMTRAALGHLQKDPDGFFMMVEGGATDWAAHTSDACAGDNAWNKDYNPGCKSVQLGRLIEETADFNDAVAAVVDWVEQNSNWQETLLIVTTDHDNSMPMGPDAERVPFQPVENRGRGRMPGFSLRATGDHSNALVPLWAKGAGAEGFARRVRGHDPAYGRHVGLSDGTYIDNTDVHAVVKAALTGQTVPAVQVGTR